MRYEGRGDAELAGSKIKPSPWLAIGCDKSGSYRVIRPRWAASETASVRLVAPSLPIIELT